MDTTFEQYKNLILKLAWSFSRSTNKELEELIGEAYLAYCEALESFIPSKSACLSTWVYICIKNHLISWIKKQPFSLGGEIDFEILSDTETPQFEFLEGLQIMSRDAQDICQMIFESPSLPQKAEITQSLRKQRWSWKRIRGGIKEIKLHLQEV